MYIHNYYRETVLKIVSERRDRMYLDGEIQMYMERYGLSYVRRLACDSVRKRIQNLSYGENTNLT